MNLSLKFRDRLYSLSAWLVQEFDQAFTAIRSVWDVEHNDDGTHGDVTVTKLTVTPGGTPEDRAQGLRKGIIVQDENTAGLGQLVNLFDGDITAQASSPEASATADATTTIGANRSWLSSVFPVLSSGSIRFGPVASGLGWARAPKASYMSGGSGFGLALIDPNVSTLLPVMWYGTDGGTPMIGSGDTGVTKLQFGSAIKSLGDGYFQNLFTTEGKIGGWTSWTPTWTNLTVGNGSVTANYARVGGITFIEVIVVFGTTTTIGGGVTIGSLPVNQTAASVQNWGTNYYYDSSAGLAIFGGNQPATATTAALTQHTNTAAGVAGTAIGPAAPFVWATSDQLYIVGFYR